jgi:molecular chaperone DnaK
MTITGGSALPKDDIERMMREAEQYAEEDRKRRESAEARNNADSLVYTTEKFLADNGDKVPSEVRDEVTAGVADVKKALEADDVDAITRSSEHLATVSQKMGQAMYAAAGAEGGAAAGGPTGAAGETATDDDVVDAEIVDEPTPGSESGAE